MSTPDHPDAGHGAGHSQSLPRPDGLPAPAVHKAAPPRTHGALPAHETHGSAAPAAESAPAATTGAAPRVEAVAPRPMRPAVARSPAVAPAHQPWPARQPWPDPFPAWRFTPRPFHEAFRVLPALIDGLPANPLRGWRWKIPLNPFRRRRPAAA